MIIDFMNINKITRIILLLSILFIFKEGFTGENTILFKIANKSITSVDFQNRKDYLLFVGDNSELNFNEIIDDFISVSIFNEYYLRTDNNKNIDNEIKDIFNKIINNSNSNLKSNLNNELYKKNILDNIKLDFIRKIILESLINKNKEQLIEYELDENQLIYNYKITYLNVYNNNVLEYEEEYNKINNQSIADIKNFLELKKIPYFLKYDQVENIDNLNVEIKEKIFNNIYFFKLHKSNYTSFISIKKEFETYEDLDATIYSFVSINDLDLNNYNCQNLENNNEYKIIKKQYEYKKLNNKIKSNLININDKIKLENNDAYTYVFLCEIKYNKELLNNLKFNKRISKKVKEIEDKFINKYSKKFNLEIFYE